MKDRNESESVRQARILAKRTARAGTMSHQQALDHVAREAGHQNWSAFLASERSDAPDPVPVKSCRGRSTNADLMPAMETSILESAALDRKTLPRWMTGSMPALGTFGWVLIGTSFGDWQEYGMLAAVICTLVVIAAGALASDGSRSIVARRTIRTYGSGIGIPVMLLGFATTILMVLLHGLPAMLYTKAAWSGPWIAATLVAVGAILHGTAKGVHAAMVLKAPGTVKPEREGPTYVEATPAVASPLVGSVSRGIVGICAAVVVVALVALVKSIVDLVRLGDLDLGLMGTSITVAMVACFVAFFASAGIDLAKPGRAMVIQDDHTRAARARRFLGIRRSRART